MASSMQVMATVHSESQNSKRDHKYENSTVYLSVKMFFNP